MGQSRSDETGRAIMALTDFRAGLYRCWTSWPDAAFELTDTVLCMPSPVASVPALSLEPAFRRSHGSLYKALARGEVDGEAMRDGGGKTVAVSDQVVIVTGSDQVDPLPLVSTACTW